MIVRPLINSRISSRLADSFRHRFIVDALIWAEATISQSASRRASIDTTYLLLTLDPKISPFGDAIVEIRALPGLQPFWKRSLNIKIEKKNASRALHLVLRNILREEKRNCSQSRNGDDNNSRSSYTLVKLSLSVV